MSTVASVACAHNPPHSLRNVQKQQLRGPLRRAIAKNMAQQGQTEDNLI